MPNRTTCYGMSRVRHSLTYVDLSFTLGMSGDPKGSGTNFRHCIATELRSSAAEKLSLTLIQLLNRMDRP